MKIRTRHDARRIELQMTSLIDIVFLLLAFFIMTFQVVAREGDFNLRLPPAGSRLHSGEITPILIRLSAAEDGALAGIRLGDRPLASIDELHKVILQIVGLDTGPGSLAESAEVRLEVDSRLDYHHVIAAVTAVSGHVEDGRVIKLIEKVQFTTPGN